ncbi:adhesion G-protein coupled receptor G4-like [Musca autumnalis]|uniref:adhesion G-protein coupled receptor G4-like n=1 Tax=Musca autumnalis TaxID=221902 RepID=UPI003CE832EB
MKFVELTILLCYLLREIVGKVPEKHAILNCKSIDFEVDYLQENGLLQREMNKWPPATVGKLVRPMQLCLLPGGISLVRRCNYNSNSSKAEWEEMDFNDIKCLGYIHENSSITFELHTLYKEIPKTGAKKNFLSAATKFYNFIEQSYNTLTVADLEISLYLLQAITKSRAMNLLPLILEIGNVLLQSNRDAIVKFKEVNGTAALLETFENYLNPMSKYALPQKQCAANFADARQFDTENIKVFYVNPTCSKVSGIVTFKRSAHNESHQMLTTDYDFQYIYLNQNLSLNEILSQSNVEVAAYVPEDLWNYAKRKNCRLKFSWYRNSNLFENVMDNNVKDSGSVLLVALPGCPGMQPHYIPPFRVGDNNSHETVQCFYWRQGAWKETTTTMMPNSNYPMICQNKTTNKPQQTQLYTSVETSRLIVSLITCILSLFGLFCILLTALFFENWRRQFSNKLLLNICAILGLFTAYLMLLNMPNIRAAVGNADRPRRCIAVGAFFQYSLLVVFLWMLFIAMLQYQRYKCVFAAQMSRNYIVRYALAAWCLPLIPTILVICLDSQAYTRCLNKHEEHFLCHPTGWSWIFGIFVPASGIILVCIAIFAFILWNIRRASKKFHLTLERDDVILHVRRSIILILVLSISWICGLLGHTSNFGFFQALFCVTSTLQGFFLFLYFVVMDKYARQYWQQYLCNRVIVVVE